jgi:hypothetical protein
MVADRQKASVAMKKSFELSLFDADPQVSPGTQGFVCKNDGQKTLAAVKNRSLFRFLMTSTPRLALVHKGLHQKANADFCRVSLRRFFSFIVNKIPQLATKSERTKKRTPVTRTRTRAYASRARAHCIAPARGHRSNPGKTTMRKSEALRLKPGDEIIWADSMWTLKAKHVAKGVVIHVTPSGGIKVRETSRRGVGWRPYRQDEIRAYWVPYHHVVEVERKKPCNGFIHVPGLKRAKPPRRSHRG